MSHERDDLWDHDIGKLLNLASGLETLDVLNVPLDGARGGGGPTACFMLSSCQQRLPEHKQQRKTRCRTSKEQPESHRLAGETQTLNDGSQPQSFKEGSRSSCPQRSSFTSLLSVGWLEDPFRGFSLGLQDLKPYWLLGQMVGLYPDPGSEWPPAGLKVTKVQPLPPLNEHHSLCPTRTCVCFTVWD